ncbi:MAG: SDR family NAD(P)-dependent oxidoreductase [Alphaproteobacteria bacterium]|jgi:NAD(P)-dependent dehydrogenase (short-subunit alcohol dehydrogenase family)|nr:SDR family NAD(P)-dependent oxidoreductase [Alphaproteobacteria bacterium]
MSIDFSDKVAVITGGGRGLGRAYALELARRGAAVVVNDTGVSIEGQGFSKNPADEVVAEIEAAGGQAVASYDDISSPQAGDAIERAVEAFGTVDILVCNAGRLEHHPFEEIPDESFTATQDVHLLGTFRAVRAAYPIMRDKGYGRIVMTTSQVGFFGKAGSVSYGAAKMGVLGILATLRLEAPAHGVQVNAISPFAGTRMSAKAFPDNLVPLISPDQVAAAVTYLCSAKCQRSGDIIVAGGGHFSAAMTVETSGIDFEDLDAISAEAIAERYGEIIDDSETMQFEDALTAVGKTFARLMERAE